MLPRNLLVAIVLLGALLIIAGAYLKITLLPGGDTVIIIGIVLDLLAIISALVHNRKTYRP